MYRNPYAFDLALARVFGWLAYLVLVAWALVWVTSTWPSPLAEHRWGVTITLAIATLGIGLTEGAVVTKYTKYEDARLEKAAASKLSQAEIDAFLNQP